MPSRKALVVFVLGTCAAALLGAVLRVSLLSRNGNTLCSGSIAADLRNILHAAVAFQVVSGR